MLPEKENLIHKFHQFHGKKIALSENRTVATVVDGFNDAVMFSEKVIQPGEIFLIKIEKLNHTLLYTDQLRFGFTQVTPEIYKYGFSASLHRQEDIDRWREMPVIFHTHCDDLLIKTTQTAMNLEISDEFITTSRGKYLRSAFKNDNFVENPTIKDLEKLNPGHKTGLFYMPYDDHVHIYCIINGHVFGPSISKPEIKEPFYFHVDLYGKIQEISIVQIQPVISPTLQNLCCSVIHQTHDLSKLDSILPKIVLDSMLFRSQKKCKKDCFSYLTDERTNFLIIYDYFSRYLICSCFI